MGEEEEEEEEKEGEEEEEEEEKEEEEGRALPGRQAPEGPAQEQGGGGGGQEEGCCDEEGRQGHLQAGHAVLRPGEGPRGAVTKAVWAYIKKKGLNKGRTVGKIEGIFGGGSMFKLAGAVSKHLK